MFNDSINGSLTAINGESLGQNVWFNGPLVGISGG